MTSLTLNAPIFTRTYSDNGAQDTVRSHGESGESHNNHVIGLYAKGLKPM